LGLRFLICQYPSLKDLTKKRIVFPRIIWFIWFNPSTTAHSYESVESNIQMYYNMPTYIL
jgi:hypothetical protein